MMVRQVDNRGEGRQGSELEEMTDGRKEKKSVGGE